MLANIATAELVLGAANGDIAQGTMKDGEAFCLELSEQRRLYDQVRILDLNGSEVVRINFNNGHPAPVPADDLQSKKGRYYFEDALSLARGQVFVSPLDLNIERGEIEQPLKPMIRFGTPVFDSAGKKRGIALLNYLAIHDLRSLAKMHESTEISHPELVNSDGYWMVGEQPEEEWGFMIPERSEITFGRKHPQIWQRIQSGESGQFEATAGLFTFTTIYPLNAGLISSTGSGLAEGHSDRKLSDSEYSWKLIAHIPQEAYTAAIDKRLKALLAGLGFGTLLLILVNWRFASLMAGKEIAQAERERLQEEMVALSRQAGMADVAKSVLHDVGNALNSINVTVNLVKEKVSDSRVESLVRISEMLASNQSDLGHFLTEDEQGKIIPAYLERLAGLLLEENRQLQGDLNGLQTAVDLLKDIVRSQQATANCGEVSQALNACEIIDDVMRSAQSTCGESGIQIQPECPSDLTVTIDRAKVLQILESLLSNARQALQATGRPDKTITLVANAEEDEYVVFEVIDNGEGIAEEDLSQIFNQGFTTRSEGLGFGLHNSANAATELGGSLTARSDGPGRGATMSLKLPRTAA